MCIVVFIFTIIVQIGVNKFDILENVNKSKGKNQDDTENDTIIAEPRKNNAAFGTPTQNYMRKRSMHVDGFMNTTVFMRNTVFSKDKATKLEWYVHFSFIQLHAYKLYLYDLNLLIFAY
jgi:hypothetical protein